MDEPLDLRMKPLSNIMVKPYPMAAWQHWRTQPISQPPLNVVEERPLTHYRCKPPVIPYKLEHLPIEQVLPHAHNSPTKPEVTSKKCPCFEHLGNNFTNDVQKTDILNVKRPAPEPTRPGKCMGLSAFSIDAILKNDTSVKAVNLFKYDTDTSTTNRVSCSDSSDSSFDAPRSFRDTGTNITIVIDAKYMNLNFGDEREYQLYQLAKKNPLLLVRMLVPNDAEAYIKFKQQYGDMPPRTKTNLNMRRKVPTKSAHSNDPDYTIKRLKNNESAKRSRDNRIAMSYEMELLDMFLTQRIEEKSRRLQINVHGRIQPMLR